MLSEVFYWLFNMSISASVAGIIILITGRIKKLPRRLVHMFWAIPFLRMWIPIGITSKYSLMELISRFTTKTVVVYDGVLNFAMTNHVMAANNYSPITYKVSILDKLFRTASIIWIIVAAAIIIATLVLYFITKTELQDASHLRDNIYVSDRISTPATYGIFSQKIIIPKGYERQDLYYILAHESVHIHRKDNLWRIVAVISASVRWFNPFIWLFLKKFLEETELACDERVLAECDKDEKKSYALALVGCAESKNVFASAFGGAKIRVRIDNILSYKKLSAIAIISLTVFAIAIAYVLLTNAS